MSISCIRGSMTRELCRLGVRALTTRYRERSLSPTEVVEAVAQRIDRIEPTLNSFVALVLDKAREEAKVLTEELARGASRSALHGIPIALKELFHVEGVPTSYGSALIKIVPDQDAASVRRLRAAGAIVVGLTRSHEWGWGITTQHPDGGGTRNPWNPARVPGGSSGGSAAAVAAGLVPLALGTDTGGSVRQPASYCGVVGFKPTYDRISRDGVLPLSPSFDHVGIMTRNAEDAAVALSVLAGDVPELPERPELAVRGLRVGLAPDLNLLELKPEYATTLDHVIQILAKEGAQLTERRGLDPDDVLATYLTIQMAEGYEVHHHRLETYPQRAADYSARIRARLEEAREIDPSRISEARANVPRIRKQFEAFFEDIDVLLTPIAAAGPSLVSKPDTVTHRGVEVPFRDLAMHYVIHQNLTGFPAITFRAGFDDERVPIGVQLTALPEKENLLLQLAGKLEGMLGSDEGNWPPLQNE